MRTSALCLVVVLAAVSSMAADLRFEPPNPTAHTSVDAVVTGSWYHGCVPVAAGVLVSGSTITLRLNAVVPPGYGCTLAISPFTARFHLDLIVPGTYTVIAFVEDNAGAGELLRRSLVVRDSESLDISPYAVPSTGSQIQILNPFFPQVPVVTFDDRTVPADSLGNLLFVAAPEHEPGAVTVGLRAPDGRTRSATAAVIYYDPAAVATAVFEPILFPLSFEGPGAFGSRWTTENFIAGIGSTAYFRDPLPCSGCTTLFGTGTKQLTNDGAESGRVLYAMRGSTSGVSFASRIRDVSQQAQSAGTEVPVVREGDFQRRRLHLLNVPVDPRSRTMLRVWTIGFTGELYAAVDGIPALLVRIQTKAVPGTGLSFGSADLTSTLQRSGMKAVSMLVYDPPYEHVPPPLWAMLSITNNDTQQVTIVTAD